MEANLHASSSYFKNNKICPQRPPRWPLWLLYELKMNEWSNKETGLLIAWLKFVFSLDGDMARISETAAAVEE